MTAQRQHEEAPQIATDQLKAFIETRLRRNEMPRQIADAVKIHLGIAIDRDHVIPFWKGEITLPTQTEHRQDKETVHPADAVDESLFTREAPEMAEAAKAPFSIVPEEDAPATQTGRRQDAAATADHTDENEAHPSPTPNEPERFTGGLQDEDSKAPRTTLTDEAKQFIVKGLACYDTPSQVAEAATQMFGVSISRQRVYRYSPDNPRPPAQRWRDLHAATRQALLREIGEIGVAHRAVRLRRLDRLESRSERSNVTTALKCLEMAAKECGGFYENRRPIALRVPVSPSLPLAELASPARLEQPLPG